MSDIRDQIFEEIGTSFRSTWELYLKFYTAFLALNLTALGLTIQFLDQGDRGPLVYSFIVQNLLAAGTAVGIGLYSHKARLHQQAVIDDITGRSASPSSPPPAYRSAIPSNLAKWGAIANAVSAVLFVCFWWGALRSHRLGNQRH